MKRREALKSTAILLGTALSASTISVVLNGCEAPQSEGWQPSVFNSKQFKLVEEVAESILPKTNTPGAKDALVHRFIDEAIRLNFSKNEKQMFLDGLKLFDLKSDEKLKKKFVDCTAVEKAAVLAELSDEAEALLAKDAGVKHIFPAFRELTVAGFFTSEIAAKEVLVFDPIPQEYRGCIDLDEVGSCWAI